MPDAILNQLRHGIISSLHQSDAELSHKDGLDVSIVTIDTKEQIMYFSGANNPIYVINNEKIVKYPADMMPIGIFQFFEPFSLTTIPLSETDKVYMLSDGYIDQFSETTGKKLTSKRFVNLFYLPST